MGECKKCGKCCHLRIEKKGIILTMSDRCIYLTNNNLCAVYNNRPFWCMSAEDMMRLKLLPVGCGYRGGN